MARDFGSPTRTPLPPPFPAGSRVRYRGDRIVRSGLEPNAPALLEPEMEVEIVRVVQGYRGTGQPVGEPDEDGWQPIDRTRDGHSVYEVHHAGRMSGRSIHPDAASEWEVVETRFSRDDVIIESGSLGLVLQAGPATFDVVWIGGGTSRYRYSTERAVRRATSSDLEGQESTIAHLRREADAARDERRRGARVKRGQIWPSR